MKIDKWQVIVILITVVLASMIALSLIHKSKEPIYLGRPLVERLQNKTMSDTSHLSISQMLSLKQIEIGEESGIATFELPISYDALTNIGHLFLLVDAKDGASQSGVGEFQECDEATNGDCLLEWNTTFDPPGKHLLQAQLIVTKQLRKPDEFKLVGPTLPYVSSNVVQFDPFFSDYNSKGAILRAKVFQTNAAYSIELRTLSGKRIKTITGSTSNGIIEEFWDLTDNQGKTYTNMNEVNVIFNVTNLPAGTFSSQKLQ